ncbi:hypothetical protein GCM10025331_17170 [Actinoplanes utahensis]|nr:hypothetical protein Aut01nite_24370 [Actinoplanes utahensis]
MLHALAALILAGGVVWWWRAAPSQAVDDRLLGWRRAAEQLLPEVGGLELSNTIALEPGPGHEEVVGVEPGDFLISAVCAGAEGSRVRISLGSGESGRGLPCSGFRTPQVFSVGLAGELHMLLRAETSGPVIFRYTLQRAIG